MKVLAICAHPDDETLGCGGTLLRHRAAGDEVSWLIATEAHEPQWSKALIDTKAREVESVAAAYGMSEVIKLGLPTIRLDTLPEAELIGRFAEALDRLQPEIIYLVYGGDVHTDHAVVYRSVMAAIKPFSMKRRGVQRILCYETLSSTEAASPARWGPGFVPQVFKDITPYIEEKLNVMALYGSELQQELMPRGASAIRALGRLRGATVSIAYAEAFMLIRELS